MSAVGLATAVLLAGCTIDPPAPAPISASTDAASEGVLWRQVEYDATRPPEDWVDTVEWVDAAEGVIRLTVMGSPHCDERLDHVRSFESGIDFVTECDPPGGPDIGEMKTFLTELPVGFDRTVPVLVWFDTRVVGELTPADEMLDSDSDAN
ncbi:hypothetical protein N1031_18665 [Herbiconiux moechotypicola]|uniref:Lipoprotein n=1 Tax=Herbiconiux moechotypicola TaxID=637393 RepID=A0ABP5R0V0_9MICO|nr:hypothetical protein [Herbiconiux moechotypicola]MCS5731782.1 hypothetical protein [Herbiconiux moechotypicola]